MWKQAFNLDQIIPLDANDNTFHHRKLSLLKLVQESYDFKQGPLLLFFEVIMFFWGK